MIVALPEEVTGTKVAGGVLPFLEQTLEYEHVGMPSTTAVSIMLARAAAIIGRPLYYRTIVSTFDASLRCIHAGLGLTIIPREIAQPAMAQGKLRVVSLKDAWADRRFCICFRDESQLSPASRLLMEHLARAPALAEPASTGPVINENIS